jgi:putative acetyltransferase
MIIRPEIDADVEAIRRLTSAAFATAPHASGAEARIVDSLRDAGALALSLVAEGPDRILVGQVSFSPVTIDGAACGWAGLGPVSVLPDRQGRGIGSGLIREGLRRLEAQGAAGCVVLGEPGYYRRFGFIAGPELHYGDVPARYFQHLVLAGPMATGEVAYHPAFDQA